ncbi:hypothetical protein CONLIGDRAFT_283038 [Coniochaeta ligniaria NRRL 30616]|uniref:Uncharacterized protein n=1 Tax=Coniochaeta ligniaria NRRL 30616 TaxID=1408157 RepID=A0A1J7ISC5_9PEZI|nr:hypothetical protein CONLIGDRAFT_283038 [Coniochaeta ligniaria NRRL 30616]
MFGNDGVSVNNVLRSFRSHRNLKSHRRIEHLQDGEQYQQLYAPVHHQRPVPNVAHHPRRPSEASSIETLNSDASFPRSSTSRRDDSIDINPLRLHPPTEDLFVPPHTHLRSPPRHHYERQQVGSSGSISSNDSAEMGHPTTSFREHQAQRGGSLEVYEGFDFGFDNRTPRPGRNTPGPGRKAAAGSGKDYFSIPVQPKSHWSRSPTPTPGTGEEDDDMEDPDETPGAGPEPGRTEWSTPPRRPRGLPLEGMDSPEYFLKRGNWKRRGIVFTATAPIASEADV